MTANEKKYLKYGSVIALIGLVYLLTRTKQESGSSNVFDNTPLPNGTLFNAKSIAELLYDAMKDSGTDEASIFNALQGVDESRFIAVSNAFGRRSYNETLGNQYNLPPWFPGYSPLPLLPLKTWLKTELSKQNYETLRLKYPNSL